MSIEHIEIEYKYNAEEISRKKFDSFVTKLAPVKKTFLLEVDASREPAINAPADHYFTKNVKFMRFRFDGKKWELTSKVKHGDVNNNVRTEYNIAIAKEMDFHKAEGFAEVFDLKHDFSIQKDVRVYWFDKMVLSHYTCYDMSGKKLNTFMEIECDEKYNWKSEQEALDELAEWERKLAPLGISPQRRIKRSLFEFYTKFGN